VPHPDQSGLPPGGLRVAVSLRALGEGHISSLALATAVIGPGRTWAFDHRDTPLVPGTTTPASWSKEHLRAVLADRRPSGELSYSVLAQLPEPFTADDVHAAVDRNPELLRRPEGRETADLIRRMVSSSYRVAYPDDVSLSQQVLLPVAEEERSDIEDARLVLFTDDDGTTDYRGTYTAYDGKHIAPRRIASDDLRSFTVSRLAGPAARNKGMALFPRRVGGAHVALCRVDGETTSIATSPDGLVWSEPEPVHAPDEPWELLQVGNCGSPVETAEGWLVLTHGVGPMRRYALGALLLDLDDPRRVVRRLRRPLLEPGPDEQEGYVPHVVYTCGGVLHDDVLWVPYGIGDARIGVASIDVPELLAAMEPAEGAQPPTTRAKSSA
jgi:predicted GH43/DUF377 family glycosyl hydrolase